MYGFQKPWQRWIGFVETLLCIFFLPSAFLAAWFTLWMSKCVSVCVCACVCLKATFANFFLANGCVFSSNVVVILDYLLL